MMLELKICHVILYNLVKMSYNLEKKSPPNESRSNLVSLESLVGICGLFSAKALIHLPSEVRERFINFASSRRWPSLPVAKQLI